MKQINGVPLDCISRISFCPEVGSRLLCASSWDCSLRLFDAEAGDMKTIFQAENFPILDCTWHAHTNSTIFGGLGKNVSVYDWETATNKQIGQHDEAVRCVRFHGPSQQVASGGWDRKLCCWDLRSPEPSFSYKCAGKVFAMGISDDYLVLGTSTRMMLIFDWRMMDRVEEREQQIKYQLRAIECFPDGKGFATASVEGRVSWEFFSQDPDVQAKKYAFKCHRKAATPDSCEVVYPVNALAFHPRYGTFATGGCDGVVAVWDGNNKKRLWRLQETTTGISSLAFSEDGGRLAIAESYTFEEGVRDNAPVSITVREVMDSEVMPKLKQG
eukprot:Platyproteum_vivax@DN8263_c0_g1_i1.p1